MLSFTNIVNKTVDQKPVLFYNVCMVRNKEQAMKGTIRFAIGFLLVAGGVGSVEQSITDGAMFAGLAWAMVGCAIMWSGVNAMNKENA